MNAAQAKDPLHGYEKALEAQKTVIKALETNPDASTMDIANDLLQMCKEQGGGDLNMAEDAILDIFYYAAQRLRPLALTKIDTGGRRASVSSITKKKRKRKAKIRKAAADTAEKIKQRIAQNLLDTTFAVARAAKALPTSMLKQGKDEETLGQYFSKDEVLPYCQK